MKTMKKSTSKRTGSTTTNAGQNRSHRQSEDTSHRCSSTINQTKKKERRYTIDSYYNMRRESQLPSPYEQYKEILKATPRVIVISGTDTDQTDYLTKNPEQEQCFDFFKQKNSLQLSDRTDSSESSVITNSDDDHNKNDNNLI